MSLCEKDCIYKGYDSTIKKSKCECPIKTSEDNIKNLLNNLMNIKDKTNLKLMKCYKKLITLEGLKANFGVNNPSSYVSTLNNIRGSFSLML